MASEMHRKTRKDQTRPFLASKCCWFSFSRTTRPSTSFGLFLQDKKDAFPHESYKAGEFMKRAAEKWRGLPFYEKEDYAVRAQKAMALYKESLNSLTDFEKDEMQKEKAQRKMERVKRKQKKMKIAFGRPKQVMNPYKYFMQDLFATKKITMGSKHISSVMREVSAKWALLPFEKKEKYIELTRKDTERYQSEMEVYVRRLRKEGHLELIPIRYRNMWLEPKEETSLENIAKSDWPDK